MLKNLTQYFTL